MPAITVDIQGLNGYIFPMDLSEKEQKPLILALDYGGTKHAAAVADAGGRVWLAHESAVSPRGADAEYDQTAMINMARKLLAGVDGQLTAVGASFGGPVEAANGMVKRSDHVPGWDNTPLAKRLTAEFGVPAVIGNDANVAALGEWKFGAGQGCASLLYVTVSTGIGGGWVLNGRIWDGADGMAGELGHTVAVPDGEPCVCGKRGCLEAEACGPAIARKMSKRQGSNSAKAWTAELVAKAAQQGNPIAQSVLSETARILGAGLGGAINLMNPERVVLGGGVTKAGEIWWAEVRAAARYHARSIMRVDILPASLGDHATLWGAVALSEAVKI